MEKLIRAEAISPDDQLIACKANSPKQRIGGGRWRTLFQFGLGKWNFNFTVVNSYCETTKMKNKYFLAKKMNYKLIDLYDLRWSPEVK